MPATAAPPAFETVADLLRSLDDIPPGRIRLRPAPGTATEEDALRALEREGRACELIDGVLVEKSVGLQESRLAIRLAYFLQIFLERHNLGVVAGADGIMKLTTGLLRIPDVSFVSWDSLPDRTVPPQPVPVLPIDLAVEVISEGNTKKEMARKLREYFDAGARLVWFVDPKTRTARVFTSAKRSTTLDESHSLDGGDVLPGFVLPLRDLFALPDRGPGA